MRRRSESIGKRCSAEAMSSARRSSASAEASAPWSTARVAATRRRSAARRGLPGAARERRRRLASLPLELGIERLGARRALPRQPSSARPARPLAAPRLGSERGGIESRRRRHRRAVRAHTRGGALPPCARPRQRRGPRRSSRSRCPSVAARCRSRTASGRSVASRSATGAVTDPGTVSSMADHPVGSAAASSSSTWNGTPSLRACSVATAWAGSSPPTISRAIARIWSRSRGRRTISSAARRATSVVPSALPTVSVPVRSVTTTGTADSSRLSARYSTTPSDSASAHCRSSTTSTAGAPGRPSVCKSRSTPSAKTRIDESAALPSSLDHSGTTRARAGTKAPIEFGGRTPTAGQRTEAPRGQDAAACRPRSHCIGRPRRAHRRPRTHAASSRTKRLFPMPAGPSTTVTRPPWLAASRSACELTVAPDHRRARGEGDRVPSVKP